MIQIRLQLLLFALVCVCSLGVLAQRETSDYQRREIQRLEREINQQRGAAADHEKLSTEIRVVLENRLSTIETKLAGIERIMWLVVGGVIAITIETIGSMVATYRHGRKGVN